MMCGCDFLRGLPTGELTGDGVGERALVASAAGHAGRSAVAPDASRGSTHPSGTPRWRRSALPGAGGEHSRRELGVRGSSR